MFAFALLALPFIAEGVLAAASAGCARSYTVAAGDTCDSISAAMKASTYQLAAVNSVINDDCTNLLPGQALCLGMDNADCTETYVVQAGDTCTAVQAAHGLNSTILSANNPNIDEECSNIYVGEVLCVAGSTSNVPLPAPNQTVKKPVPNNAVPANPQATNTAKPRPAPVPTPAPVAPKPEKDNKPEEEDHEPEGGDDDDDEDLPFCDEL